MKRKMSSDDFVDMPYIVLSRVLLPGGRAQVKWAITKSSEYITTLCQTGKADLHIAALYENPEDDTTHISLASIVIMRSCEVSTTDKGDIAVAVLSCVGRGQLLEILPRDKSGAPKARVKILPDYMIDRDLWSDAAFREMRKELEKSSAEAADALSAWLDAIATVQVVDEPNREKLKAEVLALKALKVNLGASKDGKDYLSHILTWSVSVTNNDVRIMLLSADDATILLYGMTKYFQLLTTLAQNQLAEFKEYIGSQPSAAQPQPSASQNMSEFVGQLNTLLDRLKALRGSL